MPRYRSGVGDGPISSTRQFRIVVTWENVANDGRGVIRSRALAKVSHRPAFRVPPLESDSEKDDDQKLRSSSRML
ncbi:MAG: hypothetical protein ABI321_03625, partial [Polyangia bacterium]